MEETDKWIREYELVFSSPSERLEIASIDQNHPLDIAFSVKYDPKSNSQGTMSLDIYGLSETNVSKVMQTGVKCWLSVGYRNSVLTELFVGDVREGKVISDEGKHVTKLKIMSTRTDIKPIVATLPSGETHEERITRMLGLMFKALPSLSIDAALSDLKSLVEDENNRTSLIAKGLPDRVILTDPALGSLTINDTGMESLQKMLNTFNIRAITLHDSVRLVRDGGTVKGINVTQASLGENLLKPPRKRLSNMIVPANSANSKTLVELTMLLEPKITINSSVISSHIRVDGGGVEEVATLIKVTEVSHKGRYRGSAWHTQLAGTLSEDYLAVGPIGSVALDVQKIYKDPDKSKSGTKFLRP